MTAPRISFEFFPPQTLEASFRLWDTIQTLAPYGPDFVSVTYGAGGTTRDLTRDAVKAIHGQGDLNVAAHLTCVGQSRAETLAVAEEMATVGVREIVALRGDPPKGQERFAPHPDGFTSSLELIEALKAQDRFTIRVGAYPDPHPDSRGMQDCVDFLAAKFDAGADEAITQFFFEAETFLRFRDACEKAGIDKPILPGILPIENWTGVQRFANKCGAVVPAWLSDAFEKAERDNRTDLLATAICAELCDDLMGEGVERLHFYTMNRPDLTRDVCHALGVKPKVTLSKVA